MEEQRERAPSSAPETAWLADLIDCGVVLLRVPDLLVTWANSRAAWMLGRSIRGIVDHSALSPRYRFGSATEAAAREKNPEEVRRQLNALEIYIRTVKIEYVNEE